MNKDYKYCMDKNPPGHHKITRRKTKKLNPSSLKQ